MAEREIPTPKNVQKGDTFYDQQSSQSSGMMYEPNAELVELPSHGYLYKKDTDDPDVIERGALKIRPMTVNEEKILTTTRLLRSGQALDMIFRNVIKSKIDVSKLLSSDRVFIMLWLRSVSYGNIYKFNLQCPSCSSRFEQKVDLSNHPIIEFTNPDVQEPFEITLPASKCKLTYRLPRGSDEIEIIKLNNQPKKADESDETIVKRLTSVIVKLEDSSGKEIPKNMYSQFISGLIAKDASSFRNSMDKNDCGIEDIKGIECPSCGYQYDTPIPITENFFRTTD